MTAAVARRTVLLAMPPLLIAASATLSPAAVLAAGPDHLVTFGREIARLEQEIDALGRRVRSRPSPILAEIGRLVAAIVATRAAGIPGLRLKVDLLCDAFERDTDRARELAAESRLTSPRSARPGPGDVDPLRHLHGARPRPRGRGASPRLHGTGPSEAPPGPSRWRPHRQERRRVKARPTGATGGAGAQRP